MIFEDRVDAGEKLAKALVDYSGADAVILAIPRGGVIVGEVVARQLGVPLDVVVPRKIGAPGNPELGLGAIAPGVRVIDPRMVEMLGVSESYLERQIAAEEEEIERRLRAYRGGRPSADVAGKVAVVVDDGVATGGTAFAALRWAKAQGASSVVLAVPVAPGASIGRLEQEADRVVVLSAPEPFFAVGEWYRRFDQTTDEEVVAALARAAGRQG
ncbi:MAG TPA: phosphoribosyltransferase family protein [Actinomycetota bacterium]|nr:phosphoribosyltransferase family protein [Actinomycetota bacterium]